MATDDELIKQVIAKYGTTLDLQKRPHELTEILRNFRFDDPDGGLPPGGVPEPPQPSPGPSSIGKPGDDDVKLKEVMDQLLKLSRRVEKSAKDIKTIRGHLEAARDA